ncbi:hypothetical protein E3N88_32726 [Mikania micrantha]|uniref:Uncharacterized protein n=1 Tax=Mikania micrantha TaxID=192012 RepID=A0A5N6M9V9_9ASTR|nr:hypothetical protein E3N88_32726 [Mikania micrantha]
MGRGRGKGKKLTLTNSDDTASGEEERIPAQKRNGRPHKSLVDETEDEKNTNVNDDVVSNKDVKVIENDKKRKQHKQSTEEGDLVKEEGEVGTRSNTDGLTPVNGFRHTRSRRKSKPHRAAEAGVECT